MTLEEPAGCRMPSEGRFPVGQGSSLKGKSDMKELLIVKKGMAVVNTDVIAEEFGRRHDNVMQSVRSLIDGGHLGLLDFKESEYTNKQNKRLPCYELTERGFLIAMPFIGGNKAKTGQVRLVDEFIRLRAKLAQGKMDRNTARLEYKPMTDAIKNEREALGKQISPHHFSNEADLINRIALGMTAAKFRVHNEIGKKEPIRDYLTPEQIRCITELQRANTVFISMGWDFEQRKEVLRGMFDRNHHQPLLEEHYRLAA